MNCFTRIIIINILLLAYSFAYFRLIKLDIFKIVYDIFLISLPLPPLPVEKFELLFTSVQSENLKESEIESF